MNTPKLGDVLTAEQVKALPDGAVYSVTHTYERGGWARCVAGPEYALVSLPTPPDMAPGSVVLDDRGRAWQRGQADWLHIGGGQLNWCDWSDLAPTVSFPEGVLWDAANPEGAS